MRDPSIVRGPDGLFHMVWTSGWTDRCIGYSESADLVNWSRQDSIFVMKNEPKARNCWAPEIFYDEISSNYIIIWSTTIPGKFNETAATCDNSYNHRLYYVTSKDCKTFSDTKLFYNPGFNCIDGFIIRNDRKYILVFKDETCSPAAKNFRIATADSITGPYGNLSKVLPTGSDWVEGPSLIKRGNEWLLYYDLYRNSRYGIRKSADLITWNSVSDNMVKPSGARHGTVFSATGLILDNSTAGFHFETTGNKAVSSNSKDNVPTVTILKNQLVISADPNVFNSVQLFSLDGKSIFTCKIKKYKTIMYKSDMSRTMTANSMYFLIYSGANQKYNSKLIW